MTNKGTSKIIKMASQTQKLEEARKQLKKKTAVLAGDVNEFDKEMEKFEKNGYDIVEKHISSQLVQIPNPNYHEQLTPNIPPVLTTVIISCVIFYYDHKPQPNVN